MTLSERYFFMIATPLLLWVVVGAIIAFGSSWVTSLCLTWIWQIIIACAMLGMSAQMDDVIAPRVQVKTLAGRSYQALFLVTFFMGLLILFNFGRYDEVLKMTGSWPLVIVGGILMIGGIALFVVAGRDKDHLPSGQSCSCDDESFRRLKALESSRYVYG